LPRGLYYASAVGGGVVGLQMPPGVFTMRRRLEVALAFAAVGGGVVWLAFEVEVAL
jgi:hypothetical protein